MDSNAGQAGALVPNLLWPSEGRCSAQALFVKLLVVNLGVLYAYAQLLGMRNQFSYTRLAIFFVCPAVAVWHLVVPLFCCIIHGVIHLGDANEITWIAAAMLGRIYDLDQWNSQLQLSSVNSRPNMSRRQVGKVGMIVSFMSQCLGSIYFFTRRVDNNGVIDYDIRMLSLAIGGCATVILTGFVVLFEPAVFPRDRRDPGGIGWLNLVRLVDCYDFANDRKDEFFLNMQEMLYAGAILIGVILPIEKRVRVASLVGFIVESFNKVLFMFLSAILVSSVAYASVVSLAMRLHEEQRASFRAIFTDFARAAIGGILVMLFSLCITAFFLAIVDYTIIWKTIFELQYLPQKEPCPRAWKDPQSAFIWWLA